MTVTTSQQQQIQHNELPVLYSFRNCPYCQRARMALVEAGIKVRLREVTLPQKPPELLEVSPKGTVPVLVLPDGTVIEESLGIVDWALGQGNPAALTPEEETLLREKDDFIKAYVRMKYPEKFAAEAEEDWPGIASRFLEKLERHLTDHSYLSGRNLGKTDMIIVPFVLNYSDLQGPLSFAYVNGWLQRVKANPVFIKNMQEYLTWDKNEPEPIFA